MDTAEAPKIIIATAAHGTGYVRSAQAIAEAVREIHPTCEVELVDYLTRFMSRAAAGASVGTYGISEIERSVRGFTRRRGRARLDYPGSIIRGILGTSGKSRFLKYLRNVNPDVVVANFPVPAVSLAALKEERTITCPSAVVITEYSLVEEWMHPAIDRYFVPTEEIARRISENFPSTGRVVTSGIPILKRFSLPHDRTKLLKDFGMHPNLPVVLVAPSSMGNHWSVVEIDDVLKGLTADFQVVFAAGRNRAVFEELKELVSDGHYDAVIFEYAENMDDLMAVSDLILCGGGSVIAAEALVMELPTIIYKPPGSAETLNALYLEKSGFAKYARDTGELWQSITDYLVDLDSRERAKSAAAELKKPAAARTVALELLEMAESFKEQAA